jgi:hypothetical protein
MSVLSADHLHPVHWVCVACGRERGFEDGEVFGSGVPEEDLAGVGAAEDEVGVEGGEGDGEDIGLRR